MGLSRGRSGGTRAGGTGRRTGNEPRPNSPGPASRSRPGGTDARIAAARLLDRVLRERMPLEQTAEHAGETTEGPSLAAADRALARALAAATLRHLGSIDRLLGALIARPLPRKAGFVRQILRIGCADLLHLRTPDHAAIATAVDAAKAAAATAGFAGLVNAVLRRLQREQAALLADLPPEADTPAWLWRRWTAHYGEATAHAIAAAHRTEPPLDLSAREDAALWAERLGGTLLPTGGIRLSTKAAVPDLEGFGTGAWWVQDAAASLPPKLLGDVRGRRVADLCAAPGGKTAALCLAGADVTAVDVAAERVARIEDNLTRLGLEAHLVVADVLAWQPGERFEAILLDAPCSSTGTIRRHPDVAWLKREADIGALAALQRRLLAKAAELLLPGGVLVYATCSLEPEEGEAHLASAEAETGLAHDPLQPAELGAAGCLVTSGGWLRTLPCSEVPGTPPLAGLDGFFAARFVHA